MRRSALLGVLATVVSAASPAIAPPPAAAADDRWVGTLHAYDTYTIAPITSGGTTVSQTQDATWTVDPDPTQSSWTSIFRQDETWTDAACGAMHSWVEGTNDGLLPDLELTLAANGIGGYDVSLDTGSLFMQTVFRHRETCVSSGDGWAKAIDEDNVEVVVYPPGQMGCSGMNVVSFPTFPGDPIDEEIFVECDTATAQVTVDRSSTYDWDFTTQPPGWEADVRYAYVGSALTGLIGGNAVDIRGSGASMVDEVCFYSRWEGEVRSGRGGSVAMEWNGAVLEGADLGTFDPTVGIDDAVVAGERGIWDKGKLDEWFVLRYCTAPIATADGFRTVYDLDMLVSVFQGTITEVQYSLSAELKSGGTVLRTVQLEESDTTKGSLSASWLEEETVSYP